MFNSSDAFITQMKFRELKKQRDVLLQAYAALETAVEAAPNPQSRLRRLYDSLRDITFAGQRLHPDIENLDLLLAELDYHPERTELLYQWLPQLEAELEAGKTRAEFLYIFGGLLEDWAERSRSEAETGERKSFMTQTLAFITRPAPTQDYTALLQPLSHVVPQMTEGMLDQLYEPISEEDTELILRILMGDRFRSPDVRQEARRFHQTRGLLLEFGDALTLLMGRIEDWQWDEEKGIAPHITWMRTRWRLVLDEGLPSAALLELLGRRWYQRFTDRSVLSRMVGTFPARIENPEAGWLARHTQQLTDNGAFSFLLTNIWSGERLESTNLEAIFRYVGESGGVYRQRLEKVFDLRRDAAEKMSYGLGGGTMEQALRQIHADIQITRAALPDTPLYIIKTDIKNFYPSISHDLLLAMLDTLGVPDRERAFFERYLKVPLRTDAGVQQTARGIPINCSLSHFLGELLLQFLEAHIMRAANVYLVRQMDDICLMATTEADATDAWNALQDFCAVACLTLNEDKTGAVCIGGTTPDALPQNPAQWLMLMLDDTGAWRVNEDVFLDHLERTRTLVNRERTLIEKIEQYNAGLEFLKSSVIIHRPMGDKHWADVQNTLDTFHYRFFAGGTSIIDGIRDDLAGRYMDGDAARIPEGWVYWPLTAGGLGLRTPLADIAGYRPAREERKHPTVPQTSDTPWYGVKGAWSIYYTALFDEITPQSPVSTRVMEALVQDFVARGGEISGGRLGGLSPYWRWIVYSYGLQILDTFGTFRFLITELVPVQLILQKRSNDTT